jgi:hypothetical protein
MRRRSLGRSQNPKKVQTFAAAAKGKIFLKIAG